jgi:hypothetical protein
MLFSDLARQAAAHPRVGIVTLNRTISLVVQLFIEDAHEMTMPLAKTAS